jgi:lysophospholipase L1-like esterase
MRGWELLALVVVLAVASSSAVERKPSSSAIAKGDRVLLVGDSLAVGLKVGFGELAAADGVPFAADARGGTVTRQWISRGWLVAALEQHRPTVVLVSLGTNDTTGQISATDMQRQARDLAELCRARGARVVWLVPPPMPWKLTALLEALERAGIPRVDAPAGLQRAGDRVHLTPAGYRAWATAVWRALR